MPVDTESRKCLSPIADIRGTETLHYRKGEKVARCRLATCLRIISAFGWVDDAHFSASVRSNKSSDHFLLNPPFLLAEEVSAGSLLKVGLDGGVLDGVVNDGEDEDEDAAYHANLYSKHDTINAVIVISSDKTIALSSLKHGLLPLCQEAMALGKVAYEEYDGDLSQLKHLFTPGSNVLFVRNYGVVVVGASVEEVFYNTMCVIHAIDTQLNVLPFGLDNVYLPDEKTILNSIKHLDNPLADSLHHDEHRPCDVIFRSLVRLLDNAGYHTGYEGTDKTGRRAMRSQSTTDIAPSFAVRNDGRKSALDRTATPLSFLNESFGSRSQASKWLVETSGLQKPRPATSLRHYPTNKFAPQGQNPKELKQKFKEIRKDYFEDAITSGPQSSVLEGVTWDEVRKIKASGNQSGGDSLMVTAASRGIIQRDHQKEALFYKNYTLGNPFENVTDHELEKYMKDVGKPKE